MKLITHGIDSLTLGLQPETDAERHQLADLQARLEQAGAQLRTTFHDGTVGPALHLSIQPKSAK